MTSVVLFDGSVGRPDKMPWLDTNHLVIKLHQPDRHQVSLMWEQEFDDASG